jgi:hypothetical protein
MVPLLDFDITALHSSAADMAVGEATEVLVGDGVGGATRSIQIVSSEARLQGATDTVGGSDDEAAHANSSVVDTTVYANVIHRRSEISSGGVSGGGDGGGEEDTVLGHYQSQLVHSNQKIRLGRAVGDNEAKGVEGVGVGGVWGTAKTTVENEGGNSSSAYAAALQRGGYSGTVCTSANYHEKRVVATTVELTEQEDREGSGIEGGGGAGGGRIADEESNEAHTTGTDGRALTELEQGLLRMIKQLCWPPRVFDIPLEDRHEASRRLRRLLRRKRRRARDRGDGSEDEDEDLDSEDENLDDTDDEDGEEEIWEKVLTNSRLVTKGGRQLGPMVILDILLSSHGDGAGKNPAPLLVRAVTSGGSGGGGGADMDVPGGRGSPGGGGRPSALLRALCQCGLEWRPGDEDEDELEDLALLERMKMEAAHLEQENVRLQQVNHSQCVHRVAYRQRVACAEYVQCKTCARAHSLSHSSIALTLALDEPRPGPQVYRHERGAKGTRDDRPAGQRYEVCALGDACC